MNLENKIIINSRDFPIDIDTIETIFGVAGTVICDTFKKGVVRYAFYNTGHLCEVSYEIGGKTMLVKVVSGCQHAGEEYDVLIFLERYLRLGCDECGFDVEIEYPNYTGDRFVASFEPRAVDEEEK